MSPGPGPFKQCIMCVRVCMRECVSLCLGVWGWVGVTYAGVTCEERRVRNISSAVIMTFAFWYFHFT